MNMVIIGLSHTVRERVVMFKNPLGAGGNWMRKVVPCGTLVFRIKKRKTPKYSHIDVIRPSNNGHIKGKYHLPCKHSGCLQGPIMSLYKCRPHFPS